MRGYNELKGPKAIVTAGSQCDDIRDGNCCTFCGRIVEQAGQRAPAHVLAITYLGRESTSSRLSKQSTRG